jgi:dTDP-4-dehydrorhamnose 3,5-epimerase-like enzyme
MSEPLKLIELDIKTDERGSLTFAQAGDQIPFIPMRLFTLFGIANGSVRGNHAHKEQHQYVLMMHGSAEMEVDDGQYVRRFRLERPNQALYLPPLHWLIIRNFSADAVCAVLSSGIYDADDYIADRDEFRQATRSQ